MYSYLKGDLVDIIIDCLSPIRKEYEKIIKDKEYLNSILSIGKQKATSKARKTLAKVYRIIGLVQEK